MGKTPCSKTVEKRGKKMFVYAKSLYLYITCIYDIHILPSGFSQNAVLTLNTEEFVNYLSKSEDTASSPYHPNVKVTKNMIKPVYVCSHAATDKKESKWTTICLRGKKYEMLQTLKQNFVPYHQER